MAITVYGTLNDFMAVLPSTAWGTKTTADALQAMADASAMFDDSFRGRFPLPFSRVGQSVVRRCMLLARYLFMGGRGFSPETGTDRDIVSTAKEVEEWLDKVQRRVLFPDVTIDPTATAPASLDPSPAVAQPLCISSSVTTIDGTRCATRGW